MTPAVKSTVAWNARHPVGTAVIVTKDLGERVETTTRSEAFVCNAGYPVIFCNGIRGYYLLERVTPAVGSGDPRVGRFPDHGKPRKPVKS